MPAKTTLEKLCLQREKLLSRIDAYSDFVKGSINSICSKCKRANCICETKTSKRDYRLTYKDKDQKTKIVYIPKDRLTQTKRMLGNNAKVKATIELLIEVNLKILKHRERKNRE